MEAIKDKSGREYKIFNGTAYHPETPEKLIRVLDELIQSGEKVKIYQGDIDTGMPWAEECDIIGHIGRSTGTIKIPLLVAPCAYGGPALLDHCILQIVLYPSRFILYQAKNFKHPQVEIKPVEDPKYKFETIYNGQLHGQHTSYQSAAICAAKLK